MTDAIENEIVYRGMREFIFHYKVFLIATVATVVFVLFFIPFIVVRLPYLPGDICPVLGLPGVPPCDQRTVTFGSYISNVNVGAIILIDLNIIAVSFLTVFIIIYVELRLLLYTIKPQKKKKTRTILVKRILALAAFVVIPVIIVNFMLNLFGLSLTL